MVGSEVVGSESRWEERWLWDCASCRFVATFAGTSLRLDGNGTDVCAGLKWMMGRKENTAEGYVVQRWMGMRGIGAVIETGEIGERACYLRLY